MLSARMPTTNSDNLMLLQRGDMPFMHSNQKDAIVGTSAPLKTVLQEVSLVAPTETTVLILGETGTGKELIARALHDQSKRSNRPFIRVNCAAIPPSLIASELFGHEKGAFTGALQRRLGRFEAANGGTIFLDEIGELPMETQITLLRVIQEREFERVGSSHPVFVDVRIIAATNRDLKAAVNAGTFRQDMFYRLNVFPIHLPPLRERAGDIPLLAEYLVERYANKTGKNISRITKETIQMLQAYDWPGNIRELQNVIERAVIMSEGEVVSVSENWLKRDSSRTLASSVPLVVTLAEREREVIEAALANSRGRISGPSGAAAKLGIPRQTLDSKIASLQISKSRFKS
jgi:formate hydrogenlyase transcriptional activator